MANITVDIKKKSIDIGSNLVAIGKGGMNPGVYDPQEIKADVFDMDNMVDGVDKHYLTTEQIEEFEGKQDALTAGDNIQIEDNVISATDTTYTAGDGISIDENNVITNTRVSAEWGCIQGDIGDQTDLQGALDDKQDVLTAGDNVQIENNVISATDTTYTAGEGISIDANNVISNTQTSAEWGNIEGDIEDQTDLQAALDDKQDVISDLSEIRDNATAGKDASDTIATYGDIVTHDADEFATADSVGEGVLTIQKNSTTVDTFSANATENKTINITVPTQASDIGALPDTTKYAANLDLSINSSTYVITAQLKDQDGNNIGTQRTVDLPLESVVVDGEYDAENKKIILTLENGNTIEFSVADLVSGLQTEITVDNKLDADLVDDTTASHKFITSTEKSCISTAVQPGDLATYAKCCDIPTDNSQLANGCGYTTCTGTLVPSDIQGLAQCCDVPTDNCQLANGCGYLKSSALNNYAKCCDIPTDNCQLANGCGYITCSDLPDLSGYQLKCNMVCDLTNADNDHYPTAKAVSDAMACAGVGDMLSSVYDPCGCCADAFDYCNLYNTPTIPTDNCELANSCGYVTDSYHDSTKQDTLCAGNGIDITSNTVSTASVFGQSISSAGCTEKYVCIPSIKSLSTGQMVIVKPTVTSATTSAMKLKVNNFSAYNILYNGSSITDATTAGKIWKAYAPAIFVLDDTSGTTYWRFAGNGYDNDTTYSSMGTSEIDGGTCTCLRTITAANLKYAINHYADFSCYAQCCDVPTDNCQLANGCGYTTCTGTLVASDIANLAQCCDIPTDNCQLGNSCCYATCTYVNDSINSITAYYITKNANGDQFATYAELSSATTFYSGGVVRVPTRNDYTVVLADENHDNATTRYIYQNNQWEFQYVVNETALTQAQLDALNSGITCTKVSCYDNCMAQCCDIPTDNCQLANGCGYITGISCSDVTSALGYTPYNSTNPNGYTTCTGTITENDIATCDRFGVVKLGSDIPLDMGNVNKPSDVKERTYVVQNIGKAEQMAVNVPWTDTTYCACDFDIRCLSDACGCMNTWNCKQDTLTAGNNITINANTISGDFNYATSSTAAACTTKCVCIPEITQLCVGQQITVKPSVTATNCATSLKLNNFTEYPIRYNNAALTSTTDGYVRGANCLSTFLFDGSYWQVVSKSYDINTTYTLNILSDAGKYTAGTGTYALSRYSLVMEKDDGTWEKITNTSAAYSTATTKTVNTNGFRLNKIRYYNTTTNVANGALIATNTLSNQAASVDLRYSTNCGGTTTWEEGDYIYLVGTIKADGLFYLDTTQWWTTTLPSTNDGKLYIRIGICLAANGYTASFLIDRPIFYYDNGLKIYQEADNKQDKISDLDTIRSGATCGSTSVQPGDLACYAQCCDIPTDNCQLANGCGYTTCIGTVVASDIANLAQCCDIPTNNNQLTNGCGYTTCTGTLSTCSDITTALGFTPYSAANPNGYTSCTGTLVQSDIANLAQCCDIPTNNNQLTNGCGYTTCTGTVSSCSDIISKLGYTPYSNANPSGYTSCTGTLVPSDIACINGCCLTNGGNISISGGISNDTVGTTSTVSKIWVGTEAEYALITPATETIYMVY